MRLQKKFRIQLHNKHTTGIRFVKKQFLNGIVCFSVEKTTSQKGLLLKERICSPQGAYSFL